MKDLLTDLRKIATDLEARGVVGAVTIIVAANEMERLTQELEATEAVISDYRAERDALRLEIEDMRPAT